MVINDLLVPRLQHGLYQLTFSPSFLPFTPQFQTRSSARVLRKKEERKVSECDGGLGDLVVDLASSSSSSSAAAAVSSSNGSGGGGSSNVSNAATPSSRRSWEQWSSEDKVMNTGHIGQ